MGRKNTVEIQFKANTTEMDAGIKKLKSGVTTYNAELRLNANQLKNNANDTSLLRDRQDILTQKLEATQKIVALTSDKLKMAKETWGEDSEEVQKYTRQLLAAQNQEVITQNELNATTEQLKQVEDAYAQSAKEIKT